MSAIDGRSTLARAAFKATLALLSGLTLTACALLPAPVADEVAPPRPGDTGRYVVRPTGDPRQAAFPAAGLAAQPRAAPTAAPPPSRLATGQLLGIANTTGLGMLIGLFPQRFQRWSHIGIVSVEADGVWVYDMNEAAPGAAQQRHADVSAGAATRVASRGARRRPFREAVDSETKVYGLFSPPPGVDGQRLVDFARDHWQRDTPYDDAFDSRDGSALYCAELVARGVLAAGGHAPGLVPVRRQRSMDLLRAWRRIPDAGFDVADELLSPERELVRWSKVWSASQIDAFFAAREELAARFTADVRIGELLGVSVLPGLHDEPVHWREGPRAFLDASVRLAGGRLPAKSETTAAAAAAASADLQREVARLAVRFFGPAPLTPLAPGAH